MTSSAMYCCLIGCDGVVMSLLGRFLSCLVAIGSTGGISKSACIQFCGSAMSNVLRLGVGGTSSSVGGAYRRKSGSCLKGSVRRTHSVGRPGTVGG